MVFVVVASALLGAVWQRCPCCPDDEDKKGGGCAIAQNTTSGGEQPPAKFVPLFILEGNMGLEDPVCDEVQLRLREWNVQHKESALDADAIQVTPRPWGFFSLVLISVPAAWVNTERQATLLEVCEQLRSIHDIIRFEFELTLSLSEQAQPSEGEASMDSAVAAATDKHPSLKALHAALWRKENVLRCMCEPAPRTFRVTGTRYSPNKHFTSQELSRVAGDALHERYHVPANMTDYDVNVRVIALGEDKVLLGSQLTAETLSRRHKQAFVNHVTTRSNIAYILFALARVGPGATVLDPFCGSATILLEALAASGGSITCHGVDYSPKAIRGATQNAKMEGVLDKCRFHKGDARTLTKLFEPASFDAIITNPPWGVRSGQSTDLVQLYTIFLQDAARIIKPGGRMVVFLLKAMLFVEIVRMTGKWEIEESFVVKTRNNLPTVFVLRQREDEEKAHIFAGLDALTPYCSLSSELFWSIRNKEGTDVASARGTSKKKQQQQQQAKPQ